MTLEKELEHWDGKAADDLARIYTRHHSTDTFMDDVIQLTCSGKQTSGATWLLKHHLESGGTLPQQAIQKIIQALSQLEDWQARLHILQCLPDMPITAENLKLVELFIRKGLSDNNKFVRAWSYNGFYLLAQQYPQFQAEASALFEMALKDEPASVKARVRNILKKGF